MALELGLDAAVLYSVLSQTALCLGRDSGRYSLMQRTDEAWLSSLPFLSPGRFMAALDRLSEAGLIVTERQGAERSVALLLTPSETTAGEETDPFDTPPPLPETRMLTDGTARMMHTANQPRYSDEPLYARYPEAAAVASDKPADSTNGVRRDSNSNSDSVRSNATMKLDWAPSEDCLRMLEGKGIDTEFALAQREGFVLYYRDSGQRQVSWDSKFLSWVSRRWQYHLNDRRHESQTTENSTGTHRDRRQKLRSRLRDLGDLDW